MNKNDNEQQQEHMMTQEQLSNKNKNKNKRTNARRCIHKHCKETMNHEQEEHQEPIMI